MSHDFSLEIKDQDIEYLGSWVTRFVRDYLTNIHEVPIVQSGITTDQLRATMNEPLPRKPVDLKSVLKDFEQKIASNSVRIGHPRFLAWIRTSPLAGAIFAEALAAVLNQSVAVWEGAPAATEVEFRVIEWLKKMSGYHPEASGILTSGGSMANFTCLLAARSAADPEIRFTGLVNRKPFVLYLSNESHYSLCKAAEMMGIGEQFVREIRVDEQLRMDATHLRNQIREDRRAGLKPLAVAATLGSVNTGACDDIKALAQVCEQENVWLHVDGAYGGLVNLVKGKQHLSQGLSLADSLTIDPHKNLFIPFEAGCALVKHGEYLRAAFEVPTSYLPSSEPGNPDAPIHYRDYGPQLTRSFRALKLYFTLKIYGVENLSRAIAEGYQLAEKFAEKISNTTDFEVLAPVNLGIVPFRYISSVKSDDISVESLDQLNASLVIQIQRRGRVFLSGTRIQERAALRVCFVSHRTEEEDLDIIMDEIRSVADSLTRR